MIPHQTVCIRTIRGTISPRILLSSLVNKYFVAFSVALFSVTPYLHEELICYISPETYIQSLISRSISILKETRKNSSHQRSGRENSFDLFRRCLKDINLKPAMVRQRKSVYQIQIDTGCDFIFSLFGIAIKSIFVAMSHLQMGLSVRHTFQQIL